MKYEELFKKWQDNLEEFGFKTRVKLDQYSTGSDYGVYTLALEDSGEYTNVQVTITSPTVKEILIDSYNARWCLNMHATRPSHDAIDKGALLECMPIHEKFKTFDELSEFLTNGIK